MVAAMRRVLALEAFLSLLWAGAGVRRQAAAGGREASGAAVSRESAAVEPRRWVWPPLSLLLAAGRTRAARVTEPSHGVPDFADHNVDWQSEREAMLAGFRALGISEDEQQPLLSALLDPFGKEAASASDGAAEDAQHRLFPPRRSPEDASLDEEAADLSFDPAAVFEGFDTNGDGKVDFLEFMAMAGDVLAESELFTDEVLHPMVLRWLGKLFRKSDSDGNGSLSPEEVAAAVAHIEQISKDEQLVQSGLLSFMFEVLDENGDGKVSRNELGAPSAAFLELEPGGGLAAVLDKFDTYDSDGDGALDMEEARGLVEFLVTSAAP